MIRYLALTIYTGCDEAMRGLTDKMSQPFPKVVTLQAELQRVRGQLEQEQNLLQHKEAQYRITLQEEVHSVC